MDDAAFDVEHHLTDSDSDDISPTQISRGVSRYTDMNSLDDDEDDDNNGGTEVVSEESDDESDDYDHDHDFSLHQELAHSCPLTRRELNVMKKYAVLILRLDKVSRRQSLTNLTQYVMSLTNMTEHVKKISKDVDEEQDRWENLEELLKGTVKYFNGSATENSGSGSARQSLIKFIEHVSLFSSDDETGSMLDIEDDNFEDNDDMIAFQDMPVQLMTIHSSKGLEFDVVVVSGAEEGCLPLVRRRGDENSQTLEEEERRLAYVAMTRAKSDLVLTHRRRTLQLKRNRLVSKKAKASRFLKPLSKIKRGECVFIDKSSGDAEGDDVV